MSQTVRPFDPQRIYTDHIGDRRIVYLDNNLWIDLRDGGAANACRDACVAAVRDGRVIFPLSYAAVSELLAIPSKELRERQAELMDVLSRGLTLRSPLVMYGVEASVLYRELFHDEPPTVRRNQAYTRLPDYVGDGQFSFQDGWDTSDVQKFVRLWNEDNPVTLRSIVDSMATEARAARHAESMAKYVRLMEDRQAVRRQDEKERNLDRDSATLRERVELFKAHVLSAITTELLRETRGDIVEFRRRMAAFVEERGEGNAKRITRLFRSSLPALEVVAQLHGARSVELHRRVRPQDFWDIEHASLAVVYADAFVSRDGGLMAMLRLKSQPPTAKAVLLHSVEALASWLNDLR